jgi:SAM-dependent methyltransferase
MQFYCQQVLREHGPEAPILDLGCGSGGNKRYLQALGFKRVVSVDWSASGAELLVDAHRLPFAGDTFQLVLATAVFEHLYHPFVAMIEIGRVLRKGGSFVGSASFWEAWHGNSYFHLTPDGWNALCTQARLELRDLWAGWGVIPALFSHVLVPGRLRSIGYALQNVVDRLYRWIGGETALRRFHLRASGSYQVHAVKADKSR